MTKLFYRKEKNIKLENDPRVVPFPADIGTVGIHDKGEVSDVYLKIGVRHTDWELTATVSSEEGLGDNEQTIRKLQFEVSEDLQDLSVNLAKARKLPNGFYDLICPVSVANSAGNFNGGGTGNKAILGIYKIKELLLSDFTGYSYDFKFYDGDLNTTTIQMNIDLLGDGTTRKVFLAGGFSDPAVATTFERTALGDDRYSFVHNPEIHNILAVGGLVGVTPAITTGANWWQNAYSYADILAVYPNAKISLGVNLDGGLPKKTVMPAFWIQNGDSGTIIRVHNTIETMTIQGSKIL